MPKPSRNLASTKMRGKNVIIVAHKTDDNADVVLYYCGGGHMSGVGPSNVRVELMEPGRLWIDAIGRTRWMRPESTCPTSRPTYRMVFSRGLLHPDTVVHVPSRWHHHLRQQQQQQRRWQRRLHWRPLQKDSNQVWPVSIHTVEFHRRGVLRVMTATADRFTTTTTATGFL